MRVMYASGPGDLIGTFRHWREGRDDPSQPNVTYSSALCDVIKRRGGELWAIAPLGPAATHIDGPFRIERRPIPLQRRGGVLYHAGMSWHTLRMIGSALRYRPDVFVAVGYLYWFMLGVLPWLGVKVVPSLHCVLWPKYQVAGRGRDWVLRLSRRFFRRSVSAVMVASEDIGEQVRQLTGTTGPATHLFLPLYRRETFGRFAPPDRKARPFRVLFIGRVERTKGVFDLVEIASRYKAAGRDDIAFDICGSGSALDSLRNEIESRGLADRVLCHGRCEGAVLRQHLAASHVVIVPTRTDFVEGFNQVVVEGVMAGRPVITCPVCPSAALVADAVELVPPNDVDAYHDAILRLCDDASLYERRQAACRDLGQRFFDPQWAWDAVFDRILDELWPTPDRKPQTAA